jgi:hypothetical protein
VGNVDAGFADGPQVEAVGVYELDDEHAKKIFVG